MKPENKAVKINLVGQPKELIEKIFSEWAINFGRVIIVLTELVALSALGYRFFIDRQIIDLHDKIKTKEAIVATNIRKEDEFRDIQNRLIAIKTYALESDTTVHVLNTVFEKTNSTNFAIEQLSYSKKSIALHGSAFSIFALNDLVSNLKTLSDVRSISVNNLESSDSAVDFNMAIVIK